VNEATFKESSFSSVASRNITISPRGSKLSSSSGGRRSVTGAGVAVDEGDSLASLGELVADVHPAMRTATIRSARIRNGFFMLPDIFSVRYKSSYFNPKPQIPGYFP
jgi:hypothetical protein